jgi:RNA polymerase sigma-70 factor (ECF subfamily)
MTEPHSDPGVRWMLAYQAGDEEAFDRLVELYSPQVYALLTRFLGQDPVREDLVQEVFLRVIRARGRYLPSARFSTWLYRIAFNLTLNEREKRGARLSLYAAEAGDFEESPAPEWADARTPAPAEQLEGADVVQAVRAAIAALPDRQRMALILAKYEELPYAEIAEVMDSSEKAIKSMIHRARECLRATLAPLLGGVV